jgi:hypothetical protein
MARATIRRVVGVDLLEEVQIGRWSPAGWKENASQAVPRNHPHMKHQTTRLLKFKELQNRLDLPMWQVIGMLETLWHVTLVHAPAGDIGKFTNEQIAALMDYRGDIDSLLETLLEKGWIDADPEFRLIVHDWSFHAPT